MLFLIEGDLFGLSLPINESETCKKITVICGK